MAEKFQTGIQIIIYNLKDMREVRAQIAYERQLGVGRIVSLTYVPPPETDAGFVLVMEMDR